MRRNNRLRKEYLYRKSLQGKDKEIYEKKKLIQEALDKGAPIPGKLREEASAILNDIEYDEVKEMEKEDSKYSKVTSVALAMDSEYAKAGIHDPKILITTSRNPSSKLTQFAKELKLVFPGSVRINRGNHVLQELTETCKQHQATDLILVHETRGQPDGLIVSHMPFGPTAYFSLSNVVPRHDVEDVGTMSLQNPHLIFNNFSTKLGERVTTILKYLFPPSKEENTRVITFSNEDDFISFRHHTYKKSGKEDVELFEVGPRFEMQLYQIKLGTVEMIDAETEWVLRPYMRTAKKRKAL